MAVSWLGVIVITILVMVICRHPIHQQLKKFPPIKKYPVIVIYQGHYADA